MSDIVKWGLLIAGIVSLILMILSLPFVQFLNIDELSIEIANFANVLGTPLLSARCLINNFLTPFGRKVLSGILVYTLTKWILTIGIKTTAWIYHFIFK